MIVVILYLVILLHKYDYFLKKHFSKSLFYKGKKYTVKNCHSNVNIKLVRTSEFLRFWQLIHVSKMSAI